VSERDVGWVERVKAACQKVAMGLLLSEIEVGGTRRSVVGAVDASFLMMKM
jgi:hypothetical protein